MKYTITRVRDHLEVKNNRTGKVKKYIPENFLYGQIFYLEETDKYPNYIHRRVWQLYA